MLEGCYCLLDKALCQEVCMYTGSSCMPGQSLDVGLAPASLCAFAVGAPWEMPLAVDIQLNER